MSQTPLEDIRSRLQSHTPTPPNIDHPDGVFIAPRDSNSVVQPLPLKIPDPPTILEMNYQSLKIESVDRLTTKGNNYPSWCAIQKIILDARGVLSVVEGTELAPTDAAKLIDWNAKDKFAKAQIAQNIEISLLNDMEHTSSSKLWSALEKQFSRRSDEAKAIADAKLRKKKLGDRDSLKDHLTKLCDYKSELGSAGGTISDSDWKNIILNSLTGDWKRYPASVSSRLLTRRSSSMCFFTKQRKRRTTKPTRNQ